MGVKGFAVAVAVVVLLVAVVVDAQAERGEGGNRRARPDRRRDRERTGPNRGTGTPGGKRWQGTLYGWTRDLGNGNTATERAYAPLDKQVLYHRSSGAELRGVGIVKSVNLYDFTGSSPILMISLRGRRRLGPCILTTTSFTSYQEVTDIARSRNGSTSSVTSQISLDATGEPLTPQETQEILRQSRASRRICRRGVVVRAVPAGAANPNVGETEEVKLLALDSEIMLTLPALDDRRGRGERRGQDRPGRGEGRPGRGEGRPGRGEGRPGRERGERRGNRERGERRRVEAGGQEA